jgi:hypothetical protein
LTEALPSLWGGGTTINGYSEPGSAVNTSSLSSNAQIRIQIEGKGPEAFPGLQITSGGNVVKGLAIYKTFKGIWIYGSAADNNQILGSFIGTNAAASYKFSYIPPGQAHGLHVEQGASENLIGKTALADRNVFSGNPRNGVALFHGGTVDNRIMNNLVGLSPDGSRCIANGIEGIDVNYGASYNVVGGTATNERNVSTGNGLAGIDFAHATNTVGNQAIGNYIGTNVNGKVAPSGCKNNRIGIRVKDGVRNNIVRDNVIGYSREAGVAIQGPPTQHNDWVTTNNTIRNNWIGIAKDGSPIPNAFGVTVNGTNNTIGPENRIAHNTNDGIWFEYGVSKSNRLTRNSIYNNGGLAIDLAPNGVTANDGGDGDNGPNQLLNFPVLNSASTSSVSGSACAGCTIEIYVSDVKSSTNGEGKKFVGSGTAGLNGSFTIAVSGVALGDYLTATATDAIGNTSEFSRNIAVGGSEPPPPQTVIAVPGRIEAEDYGTGGANVSYRDTTAGNSGGDCRDDDVDLNTTSDADGGCNVGWTASGEWLSYRINVASTGSYEFTARVASRNNGSHFHIEIDGVNISGPIAVPNTGDWQAWQNVRFGALPLTAGGHDLRFVFETGGFNFHYLQIDASTAAITLPGRIEAEQYRPGGEGTGYHDTSAGNNGGNCRSDDVDLQTTPDTGGGCNVGWTDAGEWLAYDISVSSTSVHTVTARVATPNSGRTFHLVLDGLTVGGPIAVPNTGGWQVWTTTIGVPITLTAGSHELRIVFDTGGANLNYITIS